MIARHWRGWTIPGNAEAYETFLRRHIFPELRRIDGHRGEFLLRREQKDETEFIVLNFFDSLESVKRFAGEQYGKAVIEPEARRLLKRWDENAEHYEVRVGPESEEEAAD